MTFLFPWQRICGDPGLYYGESSNWKNELKEKLYLVLLHEREVITGLAPEQELTQLN